jgi:LPXTG-motif cell wall-anchored protein
VREDAMGSRKLLRSTVVVLALLAALLLPTIVLAGGVAVTVDQQPADVQAGVAFSFSFTVRSAHSDGTAMGGLTPIILATNASADKQVTTTAKADGAVGHYAAAMTFPVAGEWQWQIQPFAEESQYVLALPGPLLVREAGAHTSSAAPAAAQFEVVADDSFFKVKEMQIAQGAILKWTNVGKLPHTIKAIDGSFASGNLDHNATFSFTFTKPGTYKYYCEYHGSPDGSGMFGILTVTAAAPKELPNTGTSGERTSVLFIVATLIVAAGIALRRQLADAA